MSGFLKRYGKFFSACLIAIATIGFSCVAYYDWKIKNVEEDRNEARGVFDLGERRFTRVMAEYYKTFEIRNHLQLLETLKASPEMIKLAYSDAIMTLRQAILSVSPHTDELSKEINNLNSYPELVKVFLREIRKFQLEENQRGAQIRSLESQIAGMQRIRDVFYVAFLIINAAGLLLGVFLQSQSPSADGTKPLAPRAERRRQENQ
jgi:hypothetical protein